MRLKPRRWWLILGGRNTVLGRPLSTITKLKLSVNTSPVPPFLTTSWNGMTALKKLYLLQKLNYFSVDQKILTLFFFFFLQILYWECSVIHFHLLVSVKNRNSLQRIVRIASKITAEPERDLALFCEQQILRKAHSILTRKDHILNQEFTTLPSGRRHPICKMNRFKNSFMPVALCLLNNTWSVYMYTWSMCVCVCVTVPRCVCVTLF